MKNKSTYKCEECGEPVKGDICSCVALAQMIKSPTGRSNIKELGRRLGYDI